MSLFLRPSQQDIGTAMTPGARGQGCLVGAGAGAHTVRVGFKGPGI